MGSSRRTAAITERNTDAIRDRMAKKWVGPTTPSRRPFDQPPVIVPLGELVLPTLYHPKPAWREIGKLLRWRCLVSREQEIVKGLLRVVKVVSSEG